MTDNQPPAASPAPPPRPGPVFAPPVASPGSTPQASDPARSNPTPFGTPAPNSGWAPPPKPGLIPLRPLSLGVILGASFAILRKSPQATLLPALVASLVAALAGGLFVWLTPQLALLDDAEILTALAAAVPWLLGVYVSITIAGYVAIAVTRGALGERLNARGVTARTKGREQALVGWGAIVIGVIAIVPVVIGALNIGFSPSNPASLLLAVVEPLLGVPILFALAAWLGTKFAFVPAALLVERRRLGAAIRRSWSLTRGSEIFWRVLGVRLLVWVTLVIASSVVIFGMNLLLNFGASLIFPNGGTQSVSALTFTTTVGIAIIGAVAAAVGAVASGATDALLYVDARMRREGLDLELARYIETPADQRVGDPFLPKAV